MDRVYIAIDLKSFYASVECVERHFDPLTTNLVVADSSRTEKTICLAVSPSLKAHGISGRARLFEVVQRVKEVNNKRLSAAIRSGHARKGEDGKYHFVSSSFDAPTLEKDPSLELAYYVAPPRMRLYEEYSTKIYSIYLKYIAPEDIHVYSIDEVFIDATRYLQTYNLSPHELAMSMIREVLYTTGITATAGIGTNLYLAKVAMDIVAKHVPADKDGVRIAELDEMNYRELLWCHRPLTDFWRIGRGYSTKLEAMGLFTMGDVARFSMMPCGEESPRHAHGTGNIERYTNSNKKIMQTMMALFARIIDPDLLIRRVNVCACNLIRERDIPADGPEQLSLFFDYETVKKQREAEKKDEEKERNIQRAMLDLQGRYGKNVVLKGMNLMEGATTKERNGQVGGHKAE